MLPFSEWLWAHVCTSHVIDQMLLSRWRSFQATSAAPQFQHWDTSRSLWLTWREPSTMELCFNNLMEDKACTNRPMTNTGFWSPFQTVTGAVTNDIDALRGQVSICYVAIAFTQAHLPKGRSLFQAVELNYMEWFQLFVTASSSNVVLNLWSRAMSSTFCWLTLQVHLNCAHAKAQGRWSTWVPKYFGYKIKFEMERLLWVKSAQAQLSMLLTLVPRCCQQNAWRLFSVTVASLTMVVPTQSRQRNVEVEMVETWINKWYKQPGQLHVLHFSWALSLPLALWVFQLMNVQLVFQLALVRQKIMMMITQSWSTWFCLCGAQPWLSWLQQQFGLASSGFAQLKLMQAILHYKLHKLTQLLVSTWLYSQKSKGQLDRLATRWLRPQVTWTCWQTQSTESTTVWLRLEDLPSIESLLLFNEVTRLQLSKAIE